MNLFFLIFFSDNLLQNFYHFNLFFFLSSSSRCVVCMWHESSVWNHPSLPHSDKFSFSLSVLRQFSSSSLIHDTKLRENCFLFAQFFNGKLRRKCENLSKWKIFSVTNTALLTFEWLSWISCDSLALTRISLTYMSKILSIFIQKSSQKGKRKKRIMKKYVCCMRNKKSWKKKKR